MLTNISFKNFKCYKNSDINLSNLTVLTGLNGMGKSTVIQGILGLRQSYIASKMREGLLLDGKYIELGNGKDVLYEKADELRPTIGISLTSDVGKYDYSFEYEADSKILNNVNSEQAENICDILSSEQFIYLAANRIIPQIRYGLGNNKDVDKRDFDKSGEYTLQYVDAHGSDQIDQSVDTNLNMEINKWMQEITPGVQPVITVNQDMIYSDLRFAFREGNLKTSAYRAINVGFGLTYVLPVIVTLLTSKPGDYILIENPEAHIHPRGQRKLGELLAIAAAKGAQIILETHSDHIMNGIRIAVRNEMLSKDSVCFAYFYKDVETFEHLCIYPKLASSGKFDYWPDGFFDEWDQSLMELF
ncbi:AAA family ATPase [Butyrivibrio sp. XPD2002]|uniref:AAA family ATPase n=1 Tax=Butyrivibrio sp. XPD2002 TaxID=1280665 RepID=UPI0003F99B9C|nr:DUF3696 domain-containing protein [Butyrivibrio sp. XPD2002]